MKLFNFFLLAALLFLLSCKQAKQPKVKPSNFSKEFNSNVISINNKRSDTISSQLIYDVKCLPIKNEDRFNYGGSKLKFYGDEIYMLDAVNKVFLHFDKFGDFKKNSKDLQGVLEDKYRILDFYITKEGDVKFLCPDFPKFSTFNSIGFVRDESFSFWAKEVEQMDKGLIFYSGFVNEKFGKAHYFIETLEDLKVKKKYLPVPKADIEVGMKIGTVQHHLFKSDSTLNLLTDQDYCIYTYPNLSAYRYKIKFAFDNINQLATLADKGIVKHSNFAFVRNFWESSNTVFFTYFYNKVINYAMFNKKSKKVLNKTTLNSVNDILLSNINAVHKDFFVSIISADLVYELSTLKKEQLGALANYNFKNRPYYPLMVFFKIKDF
ncbi:hypothetical protein [Pedobacter sp. MW01-1-1]|uniref:hypothetical protein n=1 Tax=Pedobacter sp. MW01-1-1 TaxID=3383027 RepID=UPI003FED849E